MGSGSVGTADHPAGRVKLCSPLGVVTVTGAAGSGTGVSVDTGVADGVAEGAAADGVAEADGVAVALFEAAGS
ncbi:hypothetical protein [Arthrobacter sp. zg-Y179]|uniref:hypothetical protein n=1 Tax=Arthrobacter sp. zg-Y179 TaxID=2894188 RepID=UPI001E2A4613|nr:hypothetical protein [Arthrobacter sp. zg-Y179]MCC9175715.1 hypothetical protein [Arthrobacter sp. zg-Y179]